MAAARPPGASIAGSASSQAASAPSSSFTAMRSAWKVRVAGWMLPRPGLARDGARDDLGEAAGVERPRRASTARFTARAMGRAKGSSPYSLQDARELALVDAARAGRRASRPRSPCACRAGRGARRRSRAPPRRAAGRRRRGRRARRPPGRCRARRGRSSRRGSRRAPRGTPRRSGRGARCAAARARGSLSMPITRAPRSSSRAEWPPPPSVPSTRSLPGPGRRISTTSLASTDSWTNSLTPSRRSRPPDPAGSPPPSAPRTPPCRRGG